MCKLEKQMAPRTQDRYKREQHTSLNPPKDELQVFLYSTNYFVELSPVGAVLGIVP